MGRGVSEYDQQVPGSVPDPRHHDRRRAEEVGAKFSPVQNNEIDDEQSMHRASAPNDAPTPATCHRDDKLPKFMEIGYRCARPKQ